jgi:hypothetical protein
MMYDRMKYEGASHFWYLIFQLIILYTEQICELMMSCFVGRKYEINGLLRCARNDAFVTIITTVPKGHNFHNRRSSTCGIGAHHNLCPKGRTYRLSKSCL